MMIRQGHGPTSSRPETKKPKISEPRSAGESIDLVMRSDGAGGHEEDDDEGK